MDFRLTKAIDAWMEKEHIMNDADILSIGGAGKPLSDDPDSPVAKMLLDQLTLSKRLHNIQTVYLIHHTDCGAYGGHSAFESREKEKQTHRADMEKEIQMIGAVISGVSVVPMLADIHEDGTVLIERV